MDDLLSNHQNTARNIKHSARIKTLLESLNLSQNEFGREIGISSAQMSLVSSGKRQISKGFAYAVNKKFPNVSADWLLTGDGEMLLEDSAGLQAEIQKRDAEMERMRQEMARLESEVMELAERLAKADAFGETMQRALNAILDKKQ